MHEVLRSRRRACRATGPCPRGPSCRRRERARGGSAPPPSATTSSPSSAGSCGGDVGAGVGERDGGDVAVARLVEADAHRADRAGVGIGRKPERAASGRRGNRRRNSRPAPTGWRRGALGRRLRPSASCAAKRPPRPAAPCPRCRNRRASSVFSSSETFSGAIATAMRGRARSASALAISKRAGST